MNIENIIQGLVKSKLDGKPGNANKDSTFELKKLQQQMRQYALQEKKPSTSYFNFLNETTFDNSEMNELADKEIVHLKSTKGWKGLPKSIQWDLIKTFLESEEFKTHVASLSEKEITAYISSIKTALLANKKELLVSYDTKLQRVLSVSI